MKHIFFLFIFCISLTQGIRAQSIYEFRDDLIRSGFENIFLTSFDNNLYLSYENNKFRFEARGLVNVIELLLNNDLYEYDKVYLQIKNQNIPLVSLEIPTDELLNFDKGLIDDIRFVNSIIIKFGDHNFDGISNDSQLQNQSFGRIDVPISLEIDYALGDYNDGFKSRIYLNPSLRTAIATGSSIEFKFQNIIQNDLPGSAISHPTIFKYSQGMRLKGNSFLYFDVGYLPQRKFGFHTYFRNYIHSEQFYVEVFYGSTRLGYLDNNWAIQTNRNSDNSWGINFNYRMNKYDTDFRLRYGTFLSGDLGYKFEISRQFHEAYFNLFYSRTDMASIGSFGTKEEGLIGFSLRIPFGMPKYSNPTKLRLRTADNFDLLYRYSGLSFSSIDLIPGYNLMSDIKEYYPEVLRRGLLRDLKRGYLND